MLNLLTISDKMTLSKTSAITRMFPVFKLTFNDSLFQIFKNHKHNGTLNLKVLHRSLQTWVHKS